AQGADLRNEPVVGEQKALEVDANGKALAAEIDVIAALPHRRDHGVVVIQLKAGLIDVVEPGKLTDSDAALRGLHLAEDDLQQSGFPEAIAPGDPVALAAFEGEVDPGEKASAPKGHSHAGQLHHAVPQLRGRGHDQLY